jgi:NodT family efflux transporter outer membrane factor (OMF) lipoprotein
VARLDQYNPNIQIYAARHRQARALLDAATAPYLPTLSNTTSLTRSQGASTGSSTVSPPHTIARSSFGLSWEADLWGRISRSVEAGVASADASAEDLEGARLSACATLIQSYLQWRINAAQRALLTRTISAYERSRDITANRVESGVAGQTDLAQARTQLESTRAQLIDLNIQRQQLENAIAVLVGQPPAALTLTRGASSADGSAPLPQLPDVPPVLPSDLLQRRPDISAAERRVAAANAQIGVNEAAFFPTLSLGASTGTQGNALGQLFSLPQHFWSVGPSAALTLFDAGARQARSAQARASWEESVASYRLTVLTAFQEVEDNLGALHTLAAEAQAQQAALNAARQTLTLTSNQYLAGTVSYLNVTSAQTTALTAERSLLDSLNRQLNATVTLFKATGGRLPPRAAPGASQG